MPAYWRRQTAVTPAAKYVLKEHTLSLAHSFALKVVSVLPAKFKEMSVEFRNNLLHLACYLDNRREEW